MYMYVNPPFMEINDDLFCILKKNLVNLFDRKSLKFKWVELLVINSWHNNHILQISLGGHTHTHTQAPRVDKCNKTIIILAVCAFLIDSLNVTEECNQL